jgi:hypothetical protein
MEKLEKRSQTRRASNYTEGQLVAAGPGLEAGRRWGIHTQCVP